MNKLLQRYNLAAASTVLVVPASATTNVGAQVAAVPLSGQWVVRMRNLAAQAIAQDNSGKLNALNFQLVWLFFDNKSNILFQFPAVDTAYSPSFTFPAQNGAWIGKRGDLNQ